MRYPILENDKVKIWRTVISPNDPLSLHRHDKQRVVVPLTDTKLKKIIDGSGRTEELEFKFRNAYWVEADPPSELHELHSDVNESDADMEVIVIEFK